MPSLKRVDDPAMAAEPATSGDSSGEEVEEDEPSSGSEAATKAQQAGAGSRGRGRGRGRRGGRGRGRGSGRGRSRGRGRGRSEGWEGAVFRGGGRGLYGGRTWMSTLFDGNISDDSLSGEPAVGRGRGGGRRGRGHGRGVPTEPPLRAPSFDSDDSTFGVSPIRFYEGVPSTWDTTSGEDSDAEPVPEAATLQRAAGLPAVTVPAHALGFLASAYGILRAFSWHLRLSPVSFEELCAAVCLPRPCPLADEVFVCLLRALAQDENRGLRASRALDLALLDELTWPEFVWEWLRLTASPLTKHYPRTAQSPATPQGTGGQVDWEAFRTSGPDSDVKALMRRGASHRPVRTEFHALPATAKAEILETLANDLLGTQWVRADLDQREADGQLVSGRGGEGGAFAMRPRSAEERQDSGGDGDGNTDICVLCLGGGSLLCCDGCPAAFHMRCIGQAGALPEGEWLCPECALGGRGEGAGVRVALAGCNASGQPHHVLFRHLFRTARGGRSGLGHKAVEELHAPLAVAVGPEAVQQAVGLTRSAGHEDNEPVPSSIDSLKDPGAEGAPELSAEGYVNRYKDSWAASSAEAKKVFELSRRKGRPPSASYQTGLLPVAEVPVPVPIPRFPWSQGKYSVILADRLASLAECVLRLEREWWCLLEGGWSSPSHLQHRRDWAARVKAAQSVTQLHAPLLEMEGALQLAALSPAWQSGQHVPSSAEQTITRWVDPDTLPEGSKRRASTEAGSSRGEEGSGAGGLVVEDAATRAFTGWAVSHRGRWERWQGHHTLPAAVAHEAARSGGRSRIQGVGYSATRPLLAPRLAWRAACQNAHTVAELALQLKVLDAQLAWDRLQPPAPDDPLALLQLEGKRREGSSWEYLAKLPVSAPVKAEVNAAVRSEVPSNGHTEQSAAAPADVQSGPTDANGEAAVQSSDLKPTTAEESLRDKEGEQPSDAPSARAKARSAATAAAAATPASAAPEPRNDSPETEARARLECGEAVWMHESDLPLAIVKSYEERQRREAGIRAALLAGRGEQCGSSDAPNAVIQETVRQAAAQACAACRLCWGEGGERDASWICCDTCQRWFHSGCSGASQDALDLAAEEDRWECNNCWLQRLAARKQAQPPKKRRPGRPPKHAAPPGDQQPPTKRRKRRSKQPPSTPPVEQLDVEKKPEPPQPAAEEAVLYCVCRQPDDGKSFEFVRCDECGEWQHPECVGVTVEQVEEEGFVCPACQGGPGDVKPEGDAVAGSRARTKGLAQPPSVSTPVGVEEIEAKEEPGPASVSDARHSSVEPPSWEAETREQRSSKRRPVDQPLTARKAKKLRVVMSNDADANGSRSSRRPRGRGGEAASSREELAAALAIVQEVAQNEWGEPFAHPVSEAEAPGYLDWIRHPMDLGTIAHRLQTGHYIDCGEVLQHVDLVWRNCRVYNTIEGSFVLEACDKAQQLFEARWAAAGLPGRPPPAVPSRKRGTPKQEVGEAVEAAASKTEQAPQQASSGRERQPSEAPREDAAKDASEATIVPGPPSSVKSKDLAAAARVIRAISKTGAGRIFAQPVSLQEAPDYRRVIRQPIDLGTILDRLQTYASLDDIVGDVNLAWANCRAYNPAAHPVLQTCQAAQQAFQERWLLAGLPSDRLFDVPEPEAVLLPRPQRRTAAKQESPVVVKLKPPASGRGVQNPSRLRRRAL